MKITKEKLQLIIKEEIAKFSGTQAGTTTEQLLDAIQSISAANAGTLQENKDVLQIMISNLQKHLTE